jgi:nitric oxide reductase NorE protein
MTSCAGNLFAPAQRECLSTDDKRKISDTRTLKEQMISTQEDRPWGALSDLPGHPMMWVLILTEIVTFGMLFMTFAVTRAVTPAIFASGQAMLDSTLGGINTIVLITSGWLAALAVEVRAAHRRRLARQLLVGSMVLGSVFIAIKIAEYTIKAKAGIGLETDTFFTLYFLLTGFHLLHVVLGIVILAVVALHDSLENLKTGTAFWHMVDLVWVLMYPLIYLVG